MKSIILAGGKGEKIWPYNEIRNKAMLPISNKPILAYTVDAIRKCNDDDVYIVGSSHMDEIRHYFRNYHHIHIVETNETNGNVETLLSVNIKEDFALFYGDCLIDEVDIISFLSKEPNTVLTYKVYDNPHNHILSLYEDDHIKNFIAYPRGYEEGYAMAGGYFKADLLELLPYNRGRFKNTKVGVGSPSEKILEESLNDYLENHILHYYTCENTVFDLDKPWHILEANAYINTKRCSSLKENKIDESAFVDEALRIDGYLQIGKNSKIGKNVYIKGNVIIGDNTIIDNGVLIEGNCVIGNNCTIQNHCKVGHLTTIGHDCIVEHTAEVSGSVIMDKNYLYHHMEFFGICGERCDLGAGTICGTLRFDDGETIHNVNGRKEVPSNFSNATFLGDYTRTGVGVIFLPGATVGTNSVVGAGSIINKKVNSNTLIYPKQELVEKEWSYKKYGW